MRSLTDLTELSEELIFTAIETPAVVPTTVERKEKRNESESEDEDDMQTLSMFLQSQLLDDENDDEKEQSKIKHCASEPTIKLKTSQPVSVTTHDDGDDDDDIWFNEDDEENLHQMIKLDQEKENQLREILGEETLDLVRNAFQVRAHQSLLDSCSSSSFFLNL